MPVTRVLSCNLHPPEVWEQVAQFLLLPEPFFGPHRPWLILPVSDDWWIVEPDLPDDDEDLSDFFFDPEMLPNWGEPEWFGR